MKSLTIQFCGIHGDLAEELSIIKIDCFVSDYPLVVTDKLENSRKITVRFSVKINNLIRRAS